MDGFKVYKYYTAIKLHFTRRTFNVFENKGHIKGKYEVFAGRNDRMLFERLARNHPKDRECIQYIACNFMYNNAEMVYNQQEAEVNFKEYTRRRQSMTKIFTDDLHTIIKSGALYSTEEFTGSKIPDVLQLYLAGKITIETMSILNDLDDIIRKARSNTQLELILDSELTRIEKTKGFVKYDSYRVMNPYQEFVQHFQEQVN